MWPISYLKVLLFILLACPNCRATKPLLYNIKCVRTNNDLKVILVQGQTLTLRSSRRQFPAAGRYMQCASFAFLLAAIKKKKWDWKKKTKKLHLCKDFNIGMNESFMWGCMCVSCKDKPASTGVWCLWSGNHGNCSWLTIVCRNIAFVYLCCHGNQNVWAFYL